MMRWLNRVLPTPLLLVVLIYFLLYGGVVFWIVSLEMQFGRSLDPNGKKQLVGLCLPGLAVYGIWRVLQFHPFTNAAYRVWLRTVPWTTGQALPFGPVHWALQDGVVVGAAVLLSWRPAGLHAWLVVLCFAICYLAALSLILFLTQARPWGYVTLLGIGWIICMHDSLVGSALAIAFAYGAGLAGLRASLRRFPWGDDHRDFQAAQNKARANANSDADLGWPLKQIAPRLAVTKTRVPALDALCVGLVASWLLFVVLSLVSSVADRREASLMVAQLTLLAVPAVRIGVYLFRHASPASPLARLATGRLLIPGYDVLFVPSILAWSAGLSCLGLLPWLPEDASIYVSPLLVFLVLSICLALEPNLADWQLTGQHSLRCLRESSNDIKVG
jgi:hypothetical protein